VTCPLIIVSVISTATLWKLPATAKLAVGILRHAYGFDHNTKIVRRAHLDSLLENWNLLLTIFVSKVGVRGNVLHRELGVDRASFRTGSVSSSRTDNELVTKVGSIVCSVAQLPPGWNRRHFAAPKAYQADIKIIAAELSTFSAKYACIGALKLNKAMSSTLQADMNDAHGGSCLRIELLFSSDRNIRLDLVTGQC
jgi:hypothetical protein